MGDSAVVFGLLVAALLCGAIGAVVAASKGRSGAGFAAGFFLGPLGWVIAALLSAAPSVQAERDRRLASEIAKATTGLAMTSGLDARTSEVDSIRQEAVAEAVRRDPSLLSASGPEEMARLREQTESIEVELRLSRDLEAVRTQQAAEIERVRSDSVRAEEERQEAEAKVLADEDARRLANDELARLEAETAERKVQAATMAPLRRVVYLHRGASIAVGSVVAVVVVVVLALQVRASSQHAEEVRLTAAAATAAANASASTSRASASAAVASVVASRASAEAEAAASVKASQDAVALAARRPICLKGARGEVKDLSGCDFSNRDLSNLDLSGRDLSGANLSSANLKRTIFGDAELFEVQWNGARCPDGALANDQGGTCEKNFLEMGDEARPLKVGQTAKIADFTVTVRSYEADARSNALAERAEEGELRAGNVYAVIKVRIKNNNSESELNGELKAEVNGEAGNCALDGGLDSVDLKPGEVVDSLLCVQIPVSAAQRGLIQIKAGYDFLDNPPAYWSIP